VTRQVTAAGLNRTATSDFGGSHGFAYL
jgi:hypothetical protein